MKIAITNLILLGLTLTVNAQIILEVEGQAKISTMQKKNTADSVVVWLDDGTMAVRDVSTLDKPNPWYLGKDTLGGIVYYIYKGSDGQEHGLIVHQDEALRQWQDTLVLTNGKRSWDGQYNTSLMIYSPAKAYVDSLGSGWYIPSKDEFVLLNHTGFHVNKALFDSGYELLFDQTIAYWTSTEHSEIFAFRAINNGFFRFDAYQKTVFVSTRAIRAF